MERRGELCPGFARVCEVRGPSSVSLPTSRATRSIHTLGRPTPHFWPKLSAVSLSRAAWVKRCWLRSFGPNPPGLASDREGKTKRLVLGNSIDFAEPLTDDWLVTVCSKIGSFSRFQAGKPKPPWGDARTVRPRESFRRITKVSRVRTQ